jgi:hypothetical protein
MFLTLIFSLLFLPLSSFARIIPRNGHTQTSSKPIGCHARYSPSHAVITFHDAGEEHDFDYAIVTKYRTYYPQQLANALQAGGYHITRLSKDEECGWHKATSVSTYGFLLDVNHGDVYWKYNDLSWVDQPEDSGIPSGWVATHNDHIPPHLDQRPSNSTIRDVAKILGNNEPAADLYYSYVTSTIVLGYLASLMAFVLLLLCITRCADARKRRQSKRTDDTEGIELFSVKVPDGIDPPKRTYTTTRSSSTSSTETLPIYSVDGAKH